MPGFFFLVVLAAGCGRPEPPDPPPAGPGEHAGMRAELVVAAQIADAALAEISGMARSGRDPRRLWVHNDSGDGPVLHAIDVAGQPQGWLELEDADNVDWEDLAAFVHEGRPYLLVADTGNNEGRREVLTLYAVAEPELPAAATLSASPAWRVDFRYPDGAYDAEAVAVDATEGAVFVLTKRDIPPVLYRVPLLPTGEQPVTATRVAALHTLPMPSMTEVEVARLDNHWHWQPTAMDLAPDGRFVAVLTYGSVYYFEREPGSGIGAALGERPLGFPLRRLRNAEALAVGADGRSIYLSVEAARAPLLRIDFEPAGVAPNGVAPNGVAPNGVAPNGVAPDGVAPDGVAPAGAAPAGTAPADSVRLMTFNVENLFDTVDDPGKDDKAFLPLAAKQSNEHRAACAAIEVASWRAECLELDWNEAALGQKLAAIGAVIRAVDAPDVIAFQEVEHAALLERLRDEELEGLGYGDAILVEGSDLRGIDVGFLARLPLEGPPRLHPVAFPDHPGREGDTRGILEATFRLPDGSLLTGFAVHFPAPYHPTAMRERAYAKLTRLLAALPPERTAFAAGDFNTTSTEVAATGILDRHARPRWRIAHEDSSCAGCLGTYYYAPDDNWSFLDMIFVRPGRGKNTTWDLREDSARVANALAAQRTAVGTPASFDAAGGTGVSDHWPLVVTLEPTQKQ